MKKSEIVKLCVFPVILAGAICALNFGLFANVSDDLTSYGQFYKEEEKCLDVVLIGNSTLREGYVPTRMWKEHGITSRGLSSSPTHPEVIKNAISQVVRYQEPKAIFIDLNGLTFQKKEDSEFFIKQYYKALPDGEFKNELAEKYDYLQDFDKEFELFNNHNNFRQQQYWESIVYPQQFQTKGYYANNIVIGVKPIELDPNKKLELPKDGEEYFDEILEECKKYSENTTFIFGRMPRYITNSTDANATYMFRTIKDKLEGYDFLFADFSMYAEDMGLSTKSDFKDHEHLNHLGALKFTDYFANYLKEEAGLVCKEREQKTIDNFNLAYEKTESYLNKIENNLKKLTKSK